MTILKANDSIPPDRREWMSILALSDLSDLEECWNRLPHQPQFAWVREPQCGAAMIRGRAGGTGAMFNLGEMTVTRCTVRLDSGAIGIAYVAGRSRRHAALAAIFDALMQRDDNADGTLHDMVRSLAANIDERRRKAAAEANASKVDFAMLVQETHNP